MGKYFEDFEAGEEYVSFSRTVTEADVCNFAGVTGDWSPVHTSIEACKKGLFGERIAHGTITITLAEGLLNRLYLWDDTFMGITDRSWDFRKPVKFGDTLSVKLKIIGKQASDQYPTCGIIEREITVVNQRNEVVTEGKGKILILKKPKG